jgi:hypothetical protein
VGEERETAQVPECEAPVEQEEVAGGCSRGAQGIRLDADDSLLGKLTKEIGDAFPKCLEEGALSDVVQMTGSGGEPYFLVHTDSRFCYNLGRCHNSNRVYFYVDSTKILQKCYCNCNTTEGRMMGLCKTYSSAPGTVSTELKQALFPESGDILINLENVDGEARKVLEKTKTVESLEKLKTSNPLEYLATEALLASAGWKR